jgi:ectoine hydroxylase-related dioxygenase (phytanoyl-CoA dioxygenase family)
MITTTELHEFWRDGVVCLRGVLSPDLLAAMAAPVEAAIAGDQSADLSALAGAPTANPRFVAGVDHWRHDARMRDFASSSPLPAIVAELLRSTVVYLYEDSVLVKEPGAAEPTQWHQDLGYFHVEGSQLCTTWCPLDPADEHTGAMRFVRGSHLRPEVYRPNLFVTADPIPGTEGEVVPDVDGGDFEIITFALAPGDITVHHARTLHAAGPNRSADRRRRAISVRYCGDDARVHFRPGAPVKAEQQSLEEGQPLGGAVHPQVWPRRISATA